jgi:hypothetical protein
MVFIFASASVRDNYTTGAMKQSPYSVCEEKGRKLPVKKIIIIQLLLFNARFSYLLGSFLSFFGMFLSLWYVG